VTQEGRLDTTFAQGYANGTGTFVPAHGAGPISGKWIHGAFQWPAADAIVFTGGIDDEGRRRGMGWCQSTASKQIDACRYKAGRQVPTYENDDD
jgi:hypothetical protein